MIACDPVRHDKKSGKQNTLRSGEFRDTRCVLNAAYFEGVSKKDIPNLIPQRGITILASEVDEMSVKRGLTHRLLRFSVMCADNLTNSFVHTPLL